MIGPIQHDFWKQHRTAEGFLDIQWFWTNTSWSRHHRSNLQRVFRLNSFDDGEHNDWIPIDAWVWHERVIVFNGIWQSLNKQGHPEINFDATFISILGEDDLAIVRDDLVLIEAIPSANIDSWHAKALDAQASPLWWRTNKELSWSKCFIDIIAQRTNHEFWAQHNLDSELRSTQASFERAWASMKVSVDLYIPIPQELSVPAWALDDSADETN